MKKYKDAYHFRFNRDLITNRIYNADDNYLKCSQRGQISRYDDNILVYESPRKIRLQKTDKETKVVLFDYRPLLIEVIDTDAERIITFLEKDFDKLQDLFKPIKRKKRILTEEQKEVLRQRMINMRKLKGINVDNDDISEEELEEEMDEELDSEDSEDDIDDETEEDDTEEI